MNETELFRIPTVKNLLTIIEAIYKSILYQGKDKALDKFKELKISYKGINNDFKQYYIFVFGLSIQKYLLSKIILN